MKKKIAIAKVNKNQLVILEIEFEEKRLSISGHHWNHLKTDYYHCGQMQDTIRKWLSGEYVVRGGIRWLISKDRVARILDIWDRWHLNDMRSECEHQRELGWTWKTHPEAPCPVCGYKLGTAWLKEEVPQSIIDELFPEYISAGGSHA